MLAGRRPIGRNVPWSASFGGVDVVVGSGWMWQCQMEVNGKGDERASLFLHKKGR